MDIFGLIALDYATSYASNVPHGERVVLGHEDLAVLSQGVWLSGELCIESYTSLDHIEHFLNIDLGDHQLSCEDLQYGSSLDFAVLLYEWS